MSGKEVVKALTKAGFKIVSQRGSHVKLKKFVDDKKLISIVPLRKTIKIKTFNSILRQANMTLEDFLKFT